MITLITGCSSAVDESINNEQATQSSVGNGLNASTTTVDKKEESGTVSSKNNSPKDQSSQGIEDAKDESNSVDSATTNSLFNGYTLITVDGGDLSGSRQAKVVVDIGYGNREYWAFTNDYGQLVRVVADRIIVQDDSTEPVLPSGRYYPDEAKVPGVEREYLDEGHVIADSLGGVSNAYNITPQDSTLNRHGDQAYMEKVIRDAGGASDFEAIISYPDTKTQIPSHYKYTYTIRGNEIVDEFDNKNPDHVNEELGLTHNEQDNTKKGTEKDSKNTNNAQGQEPDISSIDTNGNGQVTIKEAKAAGFKMPITRDHWLYPYMRDNDNDGQVGE